MAEPAPSLPPHLVFVLIKPDAVIAGKTPALLAALHTAGLRIAAWQPVTQPHESQFEELYRFNLAKRALGAEPVGWWLNRRLYTLGESLALLLQMPDAHADAAAHMTALKGPSHPWLCQPGQLRHTFCASNLAMNLIHSSDDAAATTREARLFGEPAQWQGALPGLEAADLRAQADALDARHRQALAAVDRWRERCADLHPVRVAARCALRVLAPGPTLPPQPAQVLRGLLACDDAALQRDRDACWAALEAVATHLHADSDDARCRVAWTFLRVRQIDWTRMQAQLDACRQQAAGPGVWEALVLLSTAYHRRAMFPLPAADGDA